MNKKRCSFTFFLFDCNLRTKINNNKEAKAECARIFFKNRNNKKFDFQMVRLQLPLLIIILAAGILIHFQMMVKVMLLGSVCGLMDDIHDFKLLFFSFSFFLTLIAIQFHFLLLLLLFRYLWMKFSFADARWHIRMSRFTLFYFCMFLFHFRSNALGCFRMKFLKTHVSRLHRKAIRHEIMIIKIIFIKHQLCLMNKQSLSNITKK